MPPKNGSPSLDAEQQRCANNFAPQNEKGLLALTKNFLRRFGPICSVDIACELCPEVAADLHLKSYYRPAIQPIAEQLIDRAWKHLLSNQQQNNIKAAIVFIVGGGAGSLITSALRNLPASAFKEVLCIYDATSLSLSSVNNLIEECHRRGVASIILYIDRPLPIAAKNFIKESASAGIVPSGSEFALSHFSTFNTFIALTTRHKRKSSLFSAGIVSITNDEISCGAKLRAFKKNQITVKSAESAFLNSWNALQTSFNDSTESSNPKLKPVKLPKSVTTLKHRTLLVAHLLGKNLKTHLEISYAHAATSADAGGRKQPAAIARPSSIAAAPNQELSHKRISGSKEAIEHLTSRHETTAEGQQELLDDERPQRIAVQEKKTHEHEMETILIR